jgi:hypothetical protein
MLLMLTFCVSDCYVSVSFKDTTDGHPLFVR